MYRTVGALLPTVNTEYRYIITCKSAFSLQSILTIDEFIQQSTFTVASGFLLFWFVLGLVFISDAVFRFGVEVFLCLHLKITFKNFINLRNWIHHLIFVVCTHREKVGQKHL